MCLVGGINTVLLVLVGVININMKKEIKKIDANTFEVTEPKIVKLDDIKDTVKVLNKEIKKLEQKAGVTSLYEERNRLLELISEMENA